MIHNMPGFPIIHDCNLARREIFEQEYRQEDPLYRRVVVWATHKGMTVMAIPMNAVAAGVGVGGMMATALTVGSVKVLIYAARGYMPNVPTGTLYCAERTVNHLGNIVVNVGEVLYDTLNLYRVITWVFNRILQGIVKAHEGEGGFAFTGRTPWPLRSLNNIAAEGRIDFSANVQPDRSTEKVLHHYAISLINVPANVVAATCSFVAAVILTSAFAFKAAVYAATNLDIPVRTHCYRAIEAWSMTSVNAISDLGTNFADVAVLVYKLAVATGLNRALHRAGEVIRYIPQACCSE